MIARYVTDERIYKYIKMKTPFFAFLAAYCYAVDHVALYP